MGNLIKGKLNGMFTLTFVDILGNICLELCFSSVSGHSVIVDSRQGK